MGVLYAVMLARASSESFLRSQELPAGIEVIARRTHIDLLQRTGIWENMAPFDRQAMMIPDGHWDPEMIEHTSKGMEPLRLLRWALRIDFYLSTIGNDSTPSYSIASEMVIDPDKFLAAERLIDHASLAVARTAARQYFYRCAAEAISRGYLESDDDAAKAWADDISIANIGKHDQDFLLGSKIVSEAGPAEVLRALGAAQARMGFLDWIEALRTGDAIPTLPFSFPLQPAWAFEDEETAFPN